RVDAVEAGDVDAVFVRVGAPAVMGVDAAGLAEPVLRRAGVESVEREVVRAFHDSNAIEGSGDRNRAPPSAKRTIAAPCRAEAVAQLDRKLDRAAVAGRTVRAAGFGQHQRLRRMVGIRDGA